MNAATLARMYELTYFVLTQNSEGISDDMSLWAPQPGGNCINWVLGHILAQRIPILKLAGEEPIWSVEDAAPYRRGSTPLAPARAAEARSFDSLLRDLERSQQRLLAGLARIEPERLAAPGLPGLPGGESPVGTQLAFFHFHESYHAGQTGILRRLLGLKGAIQ